MRIIFLMLSLLVLDAESLSAQQAPLNLMPLPAEYRLGSGVLVFDESFSIALTGYTEDRLVRGAQRFVTNAAKRTGMPLNGQLRIAGKATLVIHTDHASKPVQEPGEDESYSLEVTSTGARLSAATPLGTLHGLQTFLQLIEAGPSGFVVPAITVHDTPRFVWRGLMIDVGRHFMPLDVLRRNLDGMEAVKMNVFHWHLSENQGFRVQSHKFPKLTEMGSDGLYYTQEEVRELIAYARDRGIRVVPEFDMPGHATAWFVGYPEIASGPGPYQIERHWGVFDPAMDPTLDHVYKFLDEFIGEMARLFPDPYFHIGGDEVNGKQWDANPQIQAFMREHGIKSNPELQTYFTERVQKLVSKHHKIMLGWDEILSPNIAKDIVIQSWRGPESLAAAAKQGYRGLLSNGYYIDLNWPAARHYQTDPMSGAAANLTAEEKQKILGGEATMWSEYVDPENVDSRIWPRTAVIAERLWSPQNVTDVNSMYARMYQLSWRLDFLGLTHNTNYIPMLQRVAGRQDATAIRVLADVVEPVKDYNREQLAATPATQQTPLNRLVDAARPESETARLFSFLVDNFVSGQCQDAAASTQIRVLLENWRKNDSVLQPPASDSLLLREAAPISQNLAAVAGAGLGALDYIGRRERPLNPWINEQNAVIQAALKPASAQLLLAVATPIQKLVQASATTCSAK
ncbi:MAG TPA: family 20 glycosylhydrolase [Terriglobales bacterium]